MICNLLSALLRRTILWGALCWGLSAPAYGHGWEETKPINDDVAAAMANEAGEQTAEIRELTPIVPDRPPTPLELEKLVFQAKNVFALAFYDEIVVELSRALALQEAFEQRPDARLLYLRGRAAMNLGFFDMAQHDLMQLNGEEPIPNWKPVRQIVIQLARIQATKPANVFEVKRGGKVVFRVFYDVADEWTQAIIEQLPLAYKANEKTLGANKLETPVFIFANFQRLNAFYSAYGTAPTSWQWAGGNSSGLSFCPQSARGQQEAFLDTSSDYFRSSIAHEYNHCLVLRRLGRHKPPSWFIEGVAMAAEGVAVPEVQRQYTGRLTRALANQALLDPRLLSNDKFFYGTVESSAANSLSRKSGPDPYCQGWHMTQFLMSHLNGGTLSNFLDALRQSDDFDATLEYFTELTPEQFSNEWLEFARKDLG